MERLGPFLAFVLIDGIAYGMVLFLISVGLSVTMGLMRFANLAHGAFAAIGGAVAITVMTSAGVSFLLALVVAFVATALLGLLLEPFLYAPLYGGDELDQVLMTIGLIFIVIASLNLIFGSTPLPMKLPPWLAASVDFGVRVVPAYRLFLIVVGALLMVVLWLTLDRTEFGARIRAAVENPQMAQAVGIDTRRLFAVTFTLGCGLAGLGGALGAEMLPIDPVYPFRYLATFLIVVSIAGFGNIKGSAWVAMMLGLIETAGRYLLPTIAAFLTYLVMIALLLWRPDGLFAKAR
ncbi:MAG: branched-chain amino acid ABC transporter permease [Betaproteobacteria bacterium]